MIIFMLLVVVGLDFYVFSAINQLPLGHFQGGVFLAYWATVGFTFLGLFSFFRNIRMGLSSMKPSTNLLFGLAFSLIVAKLFYSFFLLGEDILRTGYYFIAQFTNDSPVSYPIRNSYLSWTGIVVSVIPFLGMSHGVIFGKYRYKTHSIKVKIKNLPKAFEGFKIAHFSDAHLGSFDNIKGLRKGIETIRKTKADVILFTGDMVNNIALEAEPYINEFKPLHAPYGKFSILGNHDYGEYIKWGSKEASETNLNRLKEIEAEMGFEMLNNDHHIIEIDGDQICLVGVENWGKPPFPQKGNLKEALKGVPHDMPTLLMSHDPSHWDLQVKQFTKPIHLTLSGHTHGMQFGIDLPFFKWSPVKWKYPKWAGLYSENEKHLYVNRGFGFIGFPGRAGIWPEITEITLTAK